MERPEGCAGTLQSSLGVRFPAIGTPRCITSQPRRSCPIPFKSRRGQRESKETDARYPCCVEQGTLPRGWRPGNTCTISQYEMAFRMQTSVPELTDLSKEPDHVLEMYGPEVKVPGTFANCCILARRMMERDVRLVQVFHRGWDQHGDLPKNIRNQAATSTNPRQHSSKTSNNAACWMKP